MNVKLLPCPECGSHDVSTALIETRPFCNNCGYWAPTDWGSTPESIEKWNKASIARLGYRNEVPEWGLDLQRRVTALEQRLKPQIVQKTDKPEPPE